MPNQYNTGPAIYQKCADPDCETQVRRTPSEVKRGHHTFCTLSCARKTPKKFKEAEIAFIMANHDKMTRNELAAHFNTTRNSLQHILMSLRMKGYAIPMEPGNKTRHHGVTRPKGYKKTNKVTQPKKTIMAHANLKKDGRSNRNSPGQTQHRDRKEAASGSRPNMRERLPDRVIDTTGCIKVRFNDKNHSEFTARDEEHAQRIREKYAYLDKPLVARLG